jgi:type I restriction enzyme S subunit
MSVWKEYKISELGKVVTGKTPSSKNPEEWGTLVAFVTPTDFDSYNKSIEGSIRYLSERGANVFNSKLLPPNSVIVTCIGSQMGKVALNKIPCVTNQQINSIILNENFNSDFIYYLISSMQDYLRNLATGGSTMPIVNKSDFENIKIIAPNLTTQTAIAEILSSLDDKIELNIKINQELESLAQTLFKQWFIDFEFPNEKGDPYKSSGGEMLENELGEIPKGWATEVLSEATKLIRGISYRKPELVSKGEGIAFVNLKCFSLNGTFRQDGIKYYNGKYKNEQILSENDILVAVTDLTQGREIIGMPILWNGSSTALPSLDTCIIRSESIELKNYLYYEFKTKRYKSRIIEHANGSTVLHLSVKGLETYVFPLPNESLLKSWSAIIQPILEKINSNINEIIELSKTRDALLPKLITGELEINEIKN